MRPTPSHRTRSASSPVATPAPTAPTPSLASRVVTPVLSAVPCWTFPPCPTLEPHEVREWARCRRNVEKGGDYTPEEDGVEAYTVKMAARFYVHWTFRRRALEAIDPPTETSVRLLQFVTAQETAARQHIDTTYDAATVQAIDFEVEVYEQKEARATGRTGGPVPA